MCLCVCHLQVYPDQSGGHHLPPNCFATCSTDGSVRFWSLDSSLPPQWKNVYSKVCVCMCDLHMEAALIILAALSLAHSASGVVEGDIHREGCDWVEGPDKGAWWVHCVH